MSSFVRQIRMHWASAGLEKKPRETGKERRWQSFVLPANETYQESHYQVSCGDNLPWWETVLQDMCYYLPGHAGTQLTLNTAHKDCFVAGPHAQVWELHPALSVTALQGVAFAACILVISLRLRLLSASPGPALASLDTDSEHLPLTQDYLPLLSHPVSR